MIEKVTHTAQFNTSATSYDDEFTFSAIGQLQRKRVYYWLNKVGFFSSSKKVVEVNCGTGYDAEQFYLKGHEVLATDISESMVAYAQQHRNKNISFKKASFQQVSENIALSEYDVLFSNFGGLNCIHNQELSDFLNQIATKQQKGNYLILVLMAKKCWIESAYFFLKGKRSLMNRRNTQTGVEVAVKDEKVMTYYYAPNEIETLLKNQYKIELIKPIACFLPPSYMEPFFKKNKTLLGVLNKLEQIFGRFTSMAKWADHYIIVAKKK